MPKINQKEILRYAGMKGENPEITEIFSKLRARGIDVPTNVYTVEQGTAILRNLIERGSAK